MHSDTGEDESGNDGKGSDSDSDGKGSDSDGERSDSDDEGTYKMFRSPGTASPDLQQVQELQAKDGTWERWAAHMAKLFKDDSDRGGMHLPKNGQKVTVFSICSGTDSALKACRVRSVCAALLARFGIYILSILCYTILYWLCCIILPSGRLASTSLPHWTSPLFATDPAAMQQPSLYGAMAQGHGSQIGSLSRLCNIERKDRQKSV